MAHARGAAGCRPVGKNGGVHGSDAADSFSSEDESCENQLAATSPETDTLAGFRRNLLSFVPRAAPMRH
jgi:hypothetical protein